MGKKKRISKRFHKKDLPVPEHISRKVSPKTIILVGIICLTGLLLRTVFIGRASYMIDEIVAIRESFEPSSYAEIFKRELEIFNWRHRLPMLFFVLRTVVKVVGYTGHFPPEWLTRLPFALFGTAALPLFFLLGKALRSQTTGLWCMFLAAFSVFFVFYCREAYDYAMVILFSTGVLWVSLELLRHWHEKRKFNWPFALGYIFFSTSLLQCHLGGLLFLGSWNALMLLSLLVSSESRRRLIGRSLPKWILAFGVSYVFLLPFLVRLLGSGFVSIEHGMIRRASWAVVPGVLGRMGWGQSVWALIPFSCFLIVGVLVACNKGTGFERRMGGLVFAQMIAYFVIQTWMLRISRFEIRYYSFMFPLLMVFVALGINGAVDWTKACIGRISVAYLHGALVVILLASFSPSLWAVINLKCRGNYKIVAEWISTNIPVNGIYTFYNVYDLRGVPGTYPTPGRFHSFPTSWSTADDYVRLQVQERLISFFRRFPLAAYIEYCPPDILGPPPDENEAKVKPVPRDQLFARQQWLGDKYYQDLIRLKTLPAGDAQWGYRVGDHVLVSYNKSEDLPGMARKRGEKFYHYFGKDWQLVKDRQHNDWRYIEKSGIIVAGNATEIKQKVSLKIVAMSQPHGCRLSVLSPSGSPLLRDFHVQLEPRDLTIPDVILEPGDNRIMLKARPLQKSQISPLFIYSFDVEQPTDGK